MASTKGSRGADATAEATSQAQAATGQRPHGDDTAVTGHGAPRATGGSGDCQFFDTTIVKLDADGREVLSDHLAPGETLRRATTDRYTAVRASTRQPDQTADTADDGT